MGDYSLGHFNFAIRKNTPKEFVKILDDFVTNGTSFEIGEHTIYLGESAYHHEKTYALREFAVESGWEYSDVLCRYSMTFQIKYGSAALSAFAKFIEPYVIADENNDGFFGYSISEHSDTVTVFKKDKE